MASLNFFGDKSGGNLQGRQLRDFLDVRRDAAASGVGPLTGQIGTSQPTQRAIETQQSLGSNLEQLFQTFGENQRQRINTDFGMAANNAIGSLQERGFGGSTGLLTDLTAVEQARTQALSDVNQNVLQQRIGAQTGIANQISGLLDSSSQQGVGVISSLLGLSNPVAGSSASSGGGGGGGGINRDPDQSEPWDPFKYLRQPGMGSGSGSSGGGGGSSGGGGGAPPMENPFFDVPTGGNTGNPWPEDADPNDEMTFVDENGAKVRLAKWNYDILPKAHRDHLKPEGGGGLEDAAGAAGGGLGGWAGRQAGGG